MPSKAEIKKMRDEFNKTGELPPHLKKMANDLKKFKVKHKVKNIVVPGMEWMSKLGEERDYKAEYKKFQSSTKSKKYRAELNKYNRKKGTYGNGDGKDASHKGGKIVGFESESKNRGRAEKSRLKKESQVNELVPPMSVSNPTAYKAMLDREISKGVKVKTALGNKKHKDHKKAKSFFQKIKDKFSKKKKEEPKKKFTATDAERAAKSAGINITGFSRESVDNKFKRIVKEELFNIMNEDKDIGHQDNEPDMLKKTALEISEYGKKLHDALIKYDDMDDEVDFPNWWQSKLILSKDYLQKAYHYLDSEEKTESVSERVPTGEQKLVYQFKRLSSTEMDELDAMLSRAGIVGTPDFNKKTWSTHANRDAMKLKRNSTLQKFIKRRGGVQIKESANESKSLKSKVKYYKTISKKEWSKTSNDYKSVIDGIKYKMFLDPKKGTILAPVKVEGIGESVNEVVSADAYTISRMMGTAQQSTQDFIDDNKIDVKKLKSYIKNVSPTKMITIKDIIHGSTDNQLRNIKKGFIKQVKESVNEAIEPSGIMAKINKIVQDKQAMKISGVLMDMFSASIMMRIYNSVNDKSKEQMNKGTMRQVQVILHKVMKQNKVTK